MDEPQPASRNLLWAVLVILILAALAITLAVAAMRARTAGLARQAMLPDGTKLELLGTSISSSNFTTETRLQAIARRLLPARFQGWIPSTITGNCTSGTNSITVYIRATNPALANAPVPWNAYVVEDAAGFLFPAEAGFCAFGSTPGSVMYGLIIRSFPRRQPAFLLHFVDTKGETIGTLHIPNPIHGPFPEWKPLPLPQTQTNGPVTLTLKSATEIGDAKWRYLNPQWTLTSTDPAWAHASAHGLTLLDATGNTGQILSRKEPAWKIQTFVYRELPQDFTPAEQITLTNLAVPAPGKFLDLDQSANLAGVKTKLLLLAGPGILTISNGVRSMTVPSSSGSVGGHSSSSGSFGKSDAWGSSTHFMLLEARNIQEGDELQFHLRDQRGRDLEVQMNGYDYLGPNARMYKPAFDPSSTATNLTIQIILNRPLPFEYLINPADVKPQKK